MTFKKIQELQMENIRKTFPGVLANDNINLHVKAGEVLALLGENGAGKSTLMKVLYGMYKPDHGIIRINGTPVSITSPTEALEKGIGMVHQHFMLVPTLTVTENVVLGLHMDPGPLLDLKKADKEVAELSAGYNLGIDPKAYVWQLSIGEQQRVEILKVLFRGASLLILDEPTAALTPQETENLIELVRFMAKQGRPIIFITHKLHEVMAISDTVVVLRNGELVFEEQTKNTNPRELAREMAGREIEAVKRTSRADIGENVLSVRNVWAKSDRGYDALANVNFTIREGEILGIAGVSGNGQKELAEVISGLRNVDKGDIHLQEHAITNKTPGEIIKKGLGFIPEDRIHVATIPTFSVWENMILKDHSREPYSKKGFLRNTSITGSCADLVSEYKIKCSELSQEVRGLSGGNIQRIVLAREISRDPILLIAMNATRGLDIGAIEYVHKRLLEARAGGRGVLLISEELDEILNLADRIAVMYEGKIMDILPAGEATKEKVGLLMAGITEQTEVPT